MTGFIAFFYKKNLCTVIFRVKLEQIHCGVLLIGTTAPYGQNHAVISIAKVMGLNSVLSLLLKVIKPNISHVLIQDYQFVGLPLSHFTCPHKTKHHWKTSEKQEHCLVKELIHYTAVKIKIW